MATRTDAKGEKLESASIYLDAGLKSYLEEHAKANRRALSSEIVVRLEKSREDDSKQRKG